MTAATILSAGLALPGTAPAQSQAPTSNVVMYGVADVGIVNERGAAAGSDTKITSGMMSASRLGLRGREDLGNGLAALFTMEMGLLLDTGELGQGGLAWGRQAFVGLDGAAGRLQLGRQYTTLAFAQVEFDPFVTGLAGTSANLISAGGRGGNNRFNNAIKYNLPNRFGGLNAELSYGFGEAGPGSRNDQIGASVGYSTGPFATRLAYANARDANGVGQDARELFWGAKYQFTALTGFVNYVRNRGAAVPGTPNFRSEDFLIGARVPVGTGTLIASYIRKNDKTAANFDAQQIGIGYTYPLSRRTTLYTSWARIKNKAPNTSATGFYRVWNANDVGNAAAGNQAISIGINHQF